jgi:hypothetical protein
MTLIGSRTIEGTKSDPKIRDSRCSDPALLRTVSVANPEIRQAVHSHDLEPRRSNTESRRLITRRIGYPTTLATSTSTEANLTESSRVARGSRCSAMKQKPAKRRRTKQTTRGGNMIFFIAVFLQHSINETRAAFAPVLPHAVY